MNPADIEGWCERHRGVEPGGCMSCQLENLAREALDMINAEGASTKLEMELCCRLVMERHARTKWQERARASGWNSKLAHPSSDAIYQLVVNGRFARASLDEDIG